MLLVHPASAGHGLNLQDGGHHLALFNGTWNYEHYAQIIERIGPIWQHQAGHPRPVFVYQIQADDTLDQVVQARVEGKADVQGLLMEYCKMKSPCEGLIFFFFFTYSQALRYELANLEWWPCFAHHLHDVLRPVGCPPLGS